MIRFLPTSGRWKKWRGLSHDERRLLLRSVALLVKARYALARIQWIPELESGVVANGDTAEARIQLQRAHLLARLVAHAAAVCPVKVACLHRSWVLWQLLGRERIPCSLRIGVRNDTSKAFGAHAWVECHGEPLHEAADLYQQFSAFSQAFVPVPHSQTTHQRSAG